ncbi:chloramphenicol-sensitive protein RarD [Stackebrandtia endophytica]|uniref:Chloramphenicol-sensitive protein RarD n=1 Tax=Stackebrandtia endophytica TaxID=1496996 RepID=A0A543AZH2_9ACTN|nr:EamA family transporter RarD [Stackebrandtia endophytica]TQL77983.1 chloramphenicol-sensitive protein RarD [Stackebrandtia endophytica]
MSELKRGYLYAGAAYGLWGLFPLYWKLLQPSSAFEILAHRMVWSMALAAIVLLSLRRIAGIRALFRNRRTVIALAAAGLFITFNWGTYIYGVNTDRVVETALGYFLNPLVTVLMGVLILGERLRRLQWAAVATGAVALAVLTIDYGQLPWIALILGFSFGFYGLIKKKTNVPAAEGLFTETAAVTLPALAFLIYLHTTGSGTFATISWAHTLLLVGGGVVTAVPLLFFAGAATRLPMSALGMGQYIAPSLQFVIGVALFNEPMSTLRWVGFGIVWLALVMFSVDALHKSRKRDGVLRLDAAIATAGADRDR